MKITRRLPVVNVRLYAARDGWVESRITFAMPHETALFLQGLAWEAFPHKNGYSGHGFELIGCAYDRDVTVEVGS